MLETDVNVWPALLVVLAFTRTDVGTVPLDTTVVADPSAAVSAEVGLRVIPPVVVVAPGVLSKVNDTKRPEIGLPLTSKTLNFTVDDSKRPGPPVPLSAIFAGSTLKNPSEPADGGNTLMVPVLVTVLVDVTIFAVIVSVDAQPLSV